MAKSNENHKTRTMNCVSGSLFLHGAVAVAVAAVAPNLDKISDTITGEFIEFEAGSPGPQIVEVAIAESPKASPAIKVKKAVKKSPPPAPPAPEPVAVKEEVVQEAPVVNVKPENPAPDTIDDGELKAELEKEKQRAKEELIKAQAIAKERQKQKELEAEMAALKEETERLKKEAEKERALIAAKEAEEQALKEQEELERAEQERLEEEERQAAILAAQQEAEEARAEAAALKEKIAAEKAAREKALKEQRAQAAGGQGQKRQGTPVAAQSFYDLRQAPGNIPPRYTNEARLAKLQGRGQLYYYVTKDGRVTNMRMTKSTGQPALDSLALQAFNDYRFIPGQEGWTVHNFEFNLRGEAQANGGRLRTTR